MASSVAFCPRCGTLRAAGARFCGSCGQDLEATAFPATASSNLPTAPTATNVEPIAGAAWIVSAAMIGYLGLVQLGYVGTIVDTGGLQGLAIWNLIAAAITIYFGARLLTRPTRGNLRSSIVWAAINVLWNGYEITQGATHWAFVGATVGALAAGVLSLVALQNRPAVVANASASLNPVLPMVGSAPAIGLAVDPRAGGRRSLEALVIVAIVAAVAIGGFLILRQTSGKVPVSGTFVLLSDSVAWSPTDCHGIGGFSDISTSAPVTLKNNSGEVVATTHLVLNPGASSASQCAYTFSTQAADADFYNVEVAGRSGPVRFPKAQAQQMDVTLQ